MPKFRRGFRTRLVLVSALFSLYGAALGARLFYLQILQHESLKEQAERQYVRTLKIHSGRGNILDRNLNPLATNVEVDSVSINPAEIQDKKYTAKMLSSILDLNRNSVLKRIKSKKQFVWIKRKCSVEETEKLKRLGLPGVDFIKEYKRFYPKRELAGNTVGFVGLDNQGLAGIEYFHENTLKGITTLRVMEKDGRKRFIRAMARSSKQNQQSGTVVLTLDEVIQFFAEYHLKQQVEKFHAKGGLAVVMSPATGEIYAMAGVPQYNPNNYSAYPASRRKNNVIVSAYEPGSIFKPIVAAAALESGAVNLHEKFFCENGDFRIGRTRIGEAANHKFGWMSLKSIIVHSSNIGAIKVAQKMGETVLYDSIRSFGFGEKMGVDLPAEATGKLHDLSKWSGLSLATVSFGHEIAVTPIQMITAFSAIANGGNLMLPYVTKEIQRNGKVVKQSKPMVVKRVLSESTSRQMVEILKDVVKHGTGKKAAIEGYEVAGKTGTAQKIDPNTQRYSHSAYLASFIGFVPADSPRLAILVMIDEPQERYWGGDVAAPVFRDIARKALHYLNIPARNERVFILDRT